MFYDKNSESDYFFFLHQNQNIFLEKNHNPPLQVKWSFPYFPRSYGPRGNNPLLDLIILDITLS